jgi:bifunctional non-homologous end joining protein LigD
MLATVGTMPTRLAEFAYEVKWDGYRALARWDGHRFALCSRNGIDLLQRFPEIAPLGRSLRHPGILDGELVAMDRHGHPGFSALQTRMPRVRGAGSGRTWDPRRFSIQYMIFDILHWAGHDLCGLPFTARRRILESLRLKGRAWKVPPVHPDGPALLEVMRSADQEGIIAKRLTSIYRPGRRSPDWIKIKLNQSEEFLIVGSWSSGKHGMSSLLLGYYPSPADAKAQRNLTYCGKVGTGFTEAARSELAAALARLAIDRCPVAGDVPRGRGVTWCRPVLVAQIHFTEWTPDGALRHPAFRGLRSDKEPSEVVHQPGRA